MKKVFITSVFWTLTTIVCYSQLAGKIFQGTLKLGSAPNTLKVVLKPSASFKGKLTNVQFTFQVPNTITPQPLVSIKNNPLATYVPTASYLTQVTNEGGFYNYLFAAAPLSTDTATFVANTEMDALEVQLVRKDTTGVTVRLASLANGGSTGQLNFYIEVSGNDNTNSTAMFYQSNANNLAVNGGSYSAYSYVSYSPVALPLKIVSFNVIKNGDNAMLNWQVENVTISNSHFDIERSINGTVYNQISKLNVLNNGSTTNAYKYIDPNISALKNNGLVYYRLRQVDKDGLYVYSQIAKIKLDATAFSLGILNNPVKDGILNLSIQSEASGEGTLRIFNAEGKAVFEAKINWAGGYSEHSTTIPALASGNYLATLLTLDKKQYQLKFVK
jgi:hypothetical protein